MNYSEHDQLPNHDAVTCPCIVYIRGEDKYYYFSVCSHGMPQREQIPRALGEYFRDQQEELSLTTLIDALGDISALAVNYDSFDTVKGLKSLVNDMQGIALQALNG